MFLISFSNFSFTSLTVSKGIRSVRRATCNWLIRLSRKRYRRSSARLEGQRETLNKTEEKKRQRPTCVFWMPNSSKRPDGEGKPAERRATKAKRVSWGNMVFSDKESSKEILNFHFVAVISDSMIYVDILSPNLWRNATEKRAVRWCIRR